MHKLFFFTPTLNPKLFEKDNPYIYYIDPCLKNITVRVRPFSVKAKNAWNVSVIV